MKAVKRSISRIVDESENGQLEDPECVVWLDRRLLKKHSLSIGQVVQLATIADKQKGEKSRKIFCKIDAMLAQEMAQQQAHSPSCIFLSALAAHQLQVSNHDTVALSVQNPQVCNA